MRKVSEDGSGEVGREQPLSEMAAAKTRNAEKDLTRRARRTEHRGRREERDFNAEDTEGTEGKRRRERLARRGIGDCTRDGGARWAGVWREVAGGVHERLQ